MKKSTLLLFFIGSYILSYTQNFQWAHKLGGHWNDEGTSIVSDNDGNVYTTGNFQGTIDFDPGVGVTNLSSAGYTDIFVTKFDAFGNLVWAKSMGGSSIFGDYGLSIAIDASNNVYVAGTYQETCDFDPGLAIYNQTSNGNEDVFIAKLDPGGNFVWANSFGGTQSDNVTSIGTDATGNIYIAGSFTEKVDFNPGTDTFFVTSNGYGSIYILKLTGSGNFVWVKTLGDDYSQSLNSFKLDPPGNMFFTGDFYGTVDFDPGAGKNTLTASGDDVFILKLDPSGNFVWVKALECDDYGAGMTIAVDATGNVHVAGFFAGTIDLDPGPAKQNFAANGTDIFILKLNSSGSLLWGRHIGSNNSDIARGIALDQADNVYTTGNFGNKVDFDPGAGVFNISSAGSEDIFVSKLNSAGIFVWAIRMGGKGFDQASSISVDGSGDIYTTGYFTGKADFDPGAGSDTLESDNEDVFISKLSAFNTGISALNNENRLTIFPNPAKDFLMISLFDNNEIKYTVFDVYGKELMNDNLNGNETRIDLDKLTAGIYFLQYGENKNNTVKFVKME